MSKNDGISGIVSDKLDKNNFYAWKVRMTSFLMGKGYWEYIVGDQEEMPELPDENPTADEIKAFKDWNQGARKVMYWLSVSVQDTMIEHIQDATSPKQAWDMLVSFDTTNTKARKMQLKTELNTVKKENLAINDYTLKIKGICESLASIGVQVEDDDKVEVKSESNLTLRYNDRDRSSEPKFDETLLACSLGYSKTTCKTLLCFDSKKSSFY
ncbi:hypothetical protein L7F22_008325 [Adiantum nelumboides]|nr:hypothetical protein [Adiantum nelumboides]